MIIRRGDIFYADLSPVVGSEQGGLRPVLIIQNDIGNKYSPTVIAAAITSRMGKTRLPTHIDIYAEKAGLAKDSVILLEQIRTLDKRRLKEKMGHLDDAIMNEVNNAIAISFGLGGILTPEEAYEPQPGAAAAVTESGTGAAAAAAEPIGGAAAVTDPGAAAAAVTEPGGGAAAVAESQGGTAAPSMGTAAAVTGPGAYSTAETEALADVPLPDNGEPGAVTA